MKLESEELTHNIIGACLEVHSRLGKGFSEIVYKDCLEIEFNLRSIPYVREKKFQIDYKGYKIAHEYNADFIVYDKVVLEVKAAEAISRGYVKQTINYLAASKLKVGLIANFGEDSLAQKRVVL
jgi:GxxExxY protein